MKIKVEVESGSFGLNTGHPNLTSSLLYGYTASLKSEQIQTLLTDKLTGGINHPQYNNYVSASIVRLRVKAKIPKWNYYFSYSSPGQLSKLDTLYPQNIEMTSEERSMFQSLSGTLAKNGGFKINRDNPLYAINSNQVADGFEKMFNSKYY